MGKTYYNLSKKVDAAGGSEICVRIYVNKNNRIRVNTSIWIGSKRWGKNEINIPSIPNEEKEILLDKKLN